MEKNFETKPQNTLPSDETMALINRYAQKELQKEDVFVFSVLLCDNEIDRDYERFSVESLKALAPLFLGKTAIKNHSMDTNDQSARTFRTTVIADANKKNSLGEAYTYLKADCYMPKLPKNEELMAEITAGIKKEVSVSCSMEASICSICGKDIRKEPCQHQRGKYYGKALCYCTLENPKDAYEWSFVAVPAQKNAGVTKEFCVEKFFQTAPKEDEISIKEKEFLALKKEFSALKAAAEDGKRYKATLKATFLKESAEAFSHFSEEMREALCRDLSTKELEIACAALKKGRMQNAMPQPQLAQPKSTKSTVQNLDFKF